MQLLRLELRDNRLLHEGLNHRFAIHDDCVGRRRFELPQEEFLVLFDEVIPSVTKILLDGGSCPLHEIKVAGGTVVVIGTGDIANECVQRVEPGLVRLVREVRITSKDRLLDMLIRECLRSGEAEAAK